MKKLILHIGLNKTGSSSIQSCLADNHSLLQQKGILYPYDPDAPFMQRWQHLPLAAALPNTKIPWLLPNKEKTLDRAYESLFQTLETTPHDQLILSSEGFCEPGMGPEKLRWLKDRFANYQITVIAYIRRQDSYFLSTYQEGVKAGRSRPIVFEDFQTHPALHFSKRLKDWRETFGAEHVIVRPFTPSLWHREELFFDFLNALDLPQEGLQPARTANEGLDYRLVELLRQLNQRNEAETDPKQKARQHRKNLRLVHQCATHLGLETEKIRLSALQSEKIRLFFRDDNIQALKGSGVDVDEFFPPTESTQTARLRPKQLDPDFLMDVLSLPAMNTPSP